MIMAPFAEVGRTEAVIKGYRAAVVAFPIDVSFAMLLADTLSCTVCFQLTVFASQILFLRILFLPKLLLAVDHASKVRLLAVVALVKGARV